jgi:uncharacterized protein
MKKNILWKGIEYESLENCLVNATDDGHEIHSTIVGGYQGKIYRVEYTIRTNTKWQTLFLQLQAWHSNKKETILLEGDAKGNWILNGKPAPEFKGCIDVDIPLTPFTNTLPVSRLTLLKGNHQQIQVIYIDVLQWQIRTVEQKYTRISDIGYHYENVPNDFEATITVDRNGLVADYPLLFKRVEILEADYR